MAFVFEDSEEAPPPGQPWRGPSDHPFSQAELAMAQPSPIVAGKKKEKEQPSGPRFVFEDEKPPSMLERAGRAAGWAAEQLTPDYQGAVESIKRVPEESRRIGEELAPGLGEFGRGIAPTIAAGRAAVSAPYSAVIPRFIQRGLDPILSGAGELVQAGVEQLVPPFLREKYKGSAAEKIVKEVSPDIGALATFGLGGELLRPGAMPLERFRPGDTMADSARPRAPGKPPSPTEIKAALGAEEKPAPKPRAPRAPKADPDAALKAKIAQNEAEIARIKAEAAQAKPPAEMKAAIKIGDETRTGPSHKAVIDEMLKDPEWQKYERAIDEGKATHGFVDKDGNFVDPSNDAPSKMAVRVLEGGEKRIGAEADPRLFREMATTMYTGDMGRVTIREAIANAVDATRPMGKNGKVDVDYSHSKKTLTVTDNGIGMLPEIVEHELVDPGASFKPEHSTGAFGMAKLAIFGNAADIQVETVAKRPDGKVLKTRTSGSADDFFSKNMKYDSHEVDPSTPTGTRVALKFHDDLPLSPYEGHYYANDFLNRQMLDFPVNIKIEGEPVLRDPRAGQLTHLKTIDHPGFAMDIYASPDVEAGQWRSVNVLNEGLPQFNQDITLPDENTSLPRNIVANVRSKVGPTDLNYPFPTSRDALRADAKGLLRGYIIGDLYRDAVSNEKAHYAQVIRNAPQIKGSAYRLVDTTGIIPKEVMGYLQTRPHAAKFMELASNVFNKALDAVRSISPEYANSKLHGIGIGLTTNEHGVGYLGINIPGKYIGLEEGAPNTILINPYIIAREIEMEVNRGMIEPLNAERAFRGRMASTVVHELTHQPERGHGVGFSGEITRNLDRTAQVIVDAMNAPSGRMYEFFRSEYQDFLHPFEESASRDIFGKIGAHAAARPEPERAAGAAGAREERRPRREEAIPGGGRVETPELAPGAAVRRTGDLNRVNVGLPIDQVKAVYNTFVRTPASKVANSLRRLWSPRGVLTEAERAAETSRSWLSKFKEERAGGYGEARKASELLIKGTSQMVENIRKIANISRVSRAVADQWSPGEVLDFYDAMEKGQRQPDPAKQAHADVMRTTLDWNQNQLTSRNLLRGVLDNYVMHMFDNADVAREAYQDLLKRQPPRQLSGPRYMLQHRTLIGTMKDIMESPIAIEKNLKMKYDNPFQAMERLVFDSQRLIRGHDLMQAFKKEGYRTLYRDKRQVPQGWDRINGYRPPQIPVKMSEAPDAPILHVPSGAYYLPQPMAAVLNNYTDAGLLSGRGALTQYLQYYRELAGFHNSLNLGWSAFHVGSTALSSWGNELKRGIMSLKAGEVVEAGKRLATATTGVGPVARDIKLGRQIKAMADDPQMQAHFPRTHEALKGYIDAGGRIEISRPFFNRWLEDKARAMEDRAIVQGANPILAKALRGLTLTEPMFEHIVGPAKIGAFASRYMDYLRQNPGLDDMGRLKGANIVMDQIEDAFGMVNYDRWGLERNVRDGLFLLLRAPGWTMGNIKIAGGGLWDLAHGRITERSATLAGQMVATAMAGTALNIAFTGKPPEVDISKPLESLYNMWNPLSGGVNADGTPARVAMAGIHRDWQTALFKIAKPGFQGMPRMAIENAANMIGSKLSPPIHTLKEWKENKNFYGEPMMDEAAPLSDQALDFAKGLFKELLPFSGSNVLQARGAGQYRPWWQGGLFGVTPAASEKIYQSRFLELMDRSQTQFGPKSPAEQTHQEARTELANRIANKQALTGLEGKVNAADVKKAREGLAVRQMPQGRLRYVLKHAQLDSITNNAQAASVEEAPLILQAMREKFRNSQTRGPMTKDKVDQYLKAQKALLQKLAARRQQMLEAQGQPNG